METKHALVACRLLDDRNKILERSGGLFAIKQLRISNSEFDLLITTPQEYCVK